MSVLFSCDVLICISSHHLLNQEVMTQSNELLSNKAGLTISKC